MLLAQEFDAVADDGVRYVSTYRRRLVAPDLRSRVVGYLGTAPVAAPGHRTDGVWVWPDALADHARAGVGPQEQLYEHLRQRSFLLPDQVSAASLDAAAAAIHGPPTVDPVPPWDWIHLGGDPEPVGRPAALLRIRLREDGSVAESMYETTGWDPSHAQPFTDPQRRRLDRRQFAEISGPEAAVLNNRLAQAGHDELVERARESPLAGADALRLARLFDGESPAGTPWFSPGRLRIPEPLRRARIAAYLRAGRLAVRASGGAPDPLDPGRVLPLSYRTDGVWVWPEALAAYLDTRGVAPELELLCHIEERGYRPPADVPAELVPRAGALIKAGPAPRLARPPLTYVRDPAGGIGRARGREPGGTETLRDDLRWARADWLMAPRRERTEAEAVDFVDRRWAAGDAVPPLD